MFVTGDTKLCPRTIQGTERTGYPPPPVSLTVPQSIVHHVTFDHVPIGKPIFFLKERGKMQTTYYSGLRLPRLTLLLLTALTKNL